MELKRSKDYISTLHELFPDVSEKDIKKIMDYGWKQLYLLNSYGGDTLVKDNTFWCYIGKLGFDSMYFYAYYVRKLAKRIRILYNRKKIQWDGYYYFGLNDEAWENLQSQKCKRGRPKKKFNYGTVRLYKIKDECLVRDYAACHIFRVPYGIDCGDTLFKKDYITEKAELILERNKPTFKDMLVSNNQYIEL